MSTEVKSRRILTDEEAQCLKNYVVLPYVLSVFARDKEIIEQKKPFKTATPYVAYLEKVMNHVNADITENKRGLQRAGIKVFEGKRSRLDVTYEYRHRGYLDKFVMMWDVMGGEVVRLMSHYLGGYRHETE